jgi:hypothetical protein
MGQHHTSNRSADSIETTLSATLPLEPENRLIP